MREIRHQTFRLATLVIAGLCTACALTTMRSIQRAPDFRSAMIHRVLVIGDFENQDIRKSFEQEFVRQWSRHGVQAVSSLEVLPSSAPLSKELVARIAKAHGFDTVLVARVLERKRIQPGEPVVPTIVLPSQGELQTSKSLRQVLLSPPVSARDFLLVTAETNLYDVASERCLWSGWSETEEMNKIPKLIPPFVKIILKHLYDPDVKTGLVADLPKESLSLTK